MKHQWNCFSVSGVSFLRFAGLRSAGQEALRVDSGSLSTPFGAAVPSAEVTLTSVETGSIAKTTSGQDGLYAFPNLQRGGYELKASAAGFR